MQVGRLANVAILLLPMLGILPGDSPARLVLALPRALIPRFVNFEPGAGEAGRAHPAVEVERARAS